jgi:asparagine synthase (glutamine-hydrolysing)
LVVTRDGLNSEPSWTPDLSRELRLGSDTDYSEAFLEVFRTAVRRRLRSAFPVGSMLSGGLDSSSVACVARDVAAADGRAPLKTYSAIWPSLAGKHPKLDERRFMDAVVATGGFEAHHVDLDRVSPLQDWQRIYWHEDQPLSAPNMYLDWSIFKTAGEHGVRVLLGGTDGDTVVGYGYEDLASFVRRGQWMKLWKESRELSRTMPKRAHSMKQLVWTHGFRTAAPELLKQLWRVLAGRPRLPADGGVPDYWKERPWNSDFVRRIDLVDRVSNLYRHSFPPNLTPRQIHWCDISSGNWSYILECFEKAAAAHRVEVRYPFFDRDVIEFCLALPPGQRLHAGFTRSILRRAMGGILPSAVQLRVDKGNLGAGVCWNLLAYERHTLEEMIATVPGVIGEYFDVAELRTKYAKYVSDPVSCQAEAFALILAAGLVLWLRGSVHPRAEEVQLHRGHSRRSGVAGFRESAKST